MHSGGRKLNQPKEPEIKEIINIYIQIKQATVLVRVSADIVFIKTNDPRD